MMIPSTQYFSLIFILLGVVFVFFTSSVSSQNLEFIELPNEDVLSQDVISGIAQDSRGIMWFTTQRGLVKFDGYRYQFFNNNPLDSTSLRSNTLTNLLISSSSPTIWVSSTTGLYQFDLVTETFVYPSGKEESSSIIRSLGVITLLEEDKQGNIWVASIFGKKLYYYNPEKDSVVTLSDSLSQKIDPVNINFDGNNLGWTIDENRRIFSFDPDKEVIQYTPAWLGTMLPGKGLLKDRAGNIIFFTNRGIYKYHFQSGSYQQLSIRTARWEDRSGKSWKEMKVKALLLDQKNRLWWRNQMELYVYDFTKGYFLDFPKRKMAETAFEDRTGTVWCGFWHGGYQRVDPHSRRMNFREFDYQGASLPVSSVHADLQDNLWLSTLGMGLTIWNRADQQVQFFPIQKKVDKVDFFTPRKVLEQDGSKIIIEANQHLNWFDPQKGTLSPFLPIGEVASVDPEWVWIYAEKELKKYRRSDWKLVDMVSLKSVDYLIFASIVAEDKDDLLWVGAESPGLLRINRKTGNQRLFRYAVAPLEGSSTNENQRMHLAETGSNLWIGEVHTMHLSKTGDLWLGAKAGGLILLSKEEKHKVNPVFRHWRAYNSGLNTDDVTAILEDEKGILWLCTNLGISSFDPQKGTFINYDKHETGQVFSLNDTKCKGKDGTFYFGGVSGLTYFHPDSISTYSNVPPIAITDFLLNNRSVPISGTFGDTLAFPSPLSRHITFTDSLVLPYDQNDLAFEFAALSYTYPGKNRYRYILENYHKDWINATADRRIASFTNLEPGSYVFRVQGSAHDGQWNLAGRSVFITITPPWWGTWWAYLSFTVLGLAFLYSIQRYQLNRKLLKAEVQQQKEYRALQTSLYTNITHEFRTPLTIILGLIDHLENQVSQHVQESLQIVRRNSKQLLRLVNQMLDLSKLESNSLTLNLEQGDIINYLRYLLESCHSLAGSKDIQLHFLSDQNAFLMDYDPVRLMHVISNLLSNAIKFTPEGGNVYVLADISETGSGKQLSIKVKDTGIGIPTEQLPYIFDRFHQVDSSATRRGEGTGIGLTLTKQLVQLMKGTIDVKSELGKGSEFVITLPVTRKQEIKSMLPAVDFVPKIPVPGKVVLKEKADAPMMLIVEDNSDLVKYLLDFFNPVFNLEVAYNGRQGIEKAISLIPDIIITDVMMPEKDGFELCDHLKQHQLTSHIPIIMLTAKVDVDSRLTGLRRGADAYLEKPFLQEELKTRVRVLLDQRQRLQAYYLSKAGLSEKTQLELPSQEEAKLENDFLAAVNQIIEKYMDDKNFTVEQLSQELYIDSSNLYRKIKALTGINPSQYIRSFRLAKAKNLLTHTNLPVISIATECGFADQNYFSRIFKKEMGVTPTKYRTQKQV